MTACSSAIPQSKLLPGYLEKKFSSLDELKIQLEKDKKFAKNQSEKIIL